MTARAMSAEEQRWHDASVRAALVALEWLRAHAERHEDIAVACARLDNYVTEQEGRWTS